MNDFSIPPGFAPSLFSLRGRTAVVTGGASGLGSAMAIGLAQAGASICLLDLSSDVCQPVVDAISSEGGHCRAFACDVTSREAVLDAAGEIGGSPDILVNSAGTAFRSPAEDFPEDQLDRVLGLNLKGTYLTCQIFGKQMLEGDGGSIINIASIGGLVAYPHASAYLASKGGVVQLTRGLALEWIGRVRVNAIAPTLFETPLTQQGASRSTVTSEFIEKRFLRQGRLGKPHEIIGAAVFLASDASALVTGHTLPVDDGYLAA